MRPFIALPFTELPVKVTDEFDPTCLLRIDRQKMEVVGRKSITHNPVHVLKEDGWKCVTPKAVTVIEIKAME